MCRKVTQMSVDVPTLFVCVFLFLLVFKSTTHIQKTSKLTMSSEFCPLCASTGLDYHVRDVSFDNAVLRVEVDHGKWSALSGNAT